MRKNIRTGILNLALAGLAVLLPGGSVPALAGVPEIINFQGKLTDPAGKPVTGPLPIVFKLYTTATGGSAVWTETQVVTLDAFGVYSVLLGEVTPLNIPFSTTYWLGMAVAGDAEMEPRYRIVSSAYSLYAVTSGTAAWAAGADWAGIANKPAVTAQGNAFNGPGQLVQVGSDGKLPALDGSSLTGLQGGSLAGYLKADGDGSRLTGVLSTNTVVELYANNGTLGVGTPFYAFVPGTDITLQKLAATVYINGSEGASVFRCGSAADFVDVVVSGSDEVGQKAVTVSSKRISRNTEVSCKMQSSTQEDTPTVALSLQYSPL
ncbi:MAG: hypothetical protein WCK76_13280 [Elusimicrobiota bacterium]